MFLRDEHHVLMRMANSRERDADDEERKVVMMGMGECICEGSLGSCWVAYLCPKAMVSPIETVAPRSRA